IAGLAANALYSLVRGSTAQAGFGNPELLANIARIAVWAFGIIVAVNQLGIAATLINILFMAVVGALALAFGLAFGLGGRDTAGRMVQEWYESGRKAAPKVRQAAEEARREGEEGGRRAA
ncbi:MAG: mechanosensitive ion channel family protein, partial [Chloroflexota bacterium]